MADFYLLLIKALKTGNLLVACKNSFICLLFGLEIALFYLKLTCKMQEGEKPLFVHHVACGG